MDRENGLTTMSCTYHPLCHIVAASVRDGGPLPRTDIPPQWNVPRRISAMCRAVLGSTAAILKGRDIPLDTLPVVFASRYSELYRTMQLLREWGEFGDMSPAGFSLSVHNAPASMLSLAIKGHGSFTTMAAAGETLRTGLLHAGLTAQSKGRCLFVYAESYTPGEEACRACSALLEAGDTELPLPGTLEELLPLLP